MKVVKYCTTSAFMRTLPLYTFGMSLFKIFFCTESAYHHQWWCVPWQVIMFPMVIYTIYFLISLVKAVKLANQLKNIGEHIDIEVG